MKVEVTRFNEPFGLQNATTIFPGFVTEVPVRELPASATVSGSADDGGRIHFLNMDGPVHASGCGRGRADEAKGPSKLCWLAPQL